MPDRDDCLDLGLQRIRKNMRSSKDDRARPHGLRIPEPIADPILAMLHVEENEAVLDLLEIRLGMLRQRRVDALLDIADDKSATERARPSRRPWAMAFGR